MDGTADYGVEQKSHGLSLIVLADLLTQFSSPHRTVMLNNPKQPWATYNSPLGALFCLLGIDRTNAELLLKALEEQDQRLTQQVSVNNFATRHAGKHFSTLMILYVLYERLLNQSVNRKSSVDGEFEAKAIFNTLGRVGQPVVAPYFSFLAFLIHFQTIPDSENLEYIFWLLTKGQRTLDRSEVALLLQMLLLERKDTFVSKYKETIEKLLVEQASEAIVLTRFQVINATFGGIFVSCITELRATLQKSIMGKEFWRKSIKEIQASLIGINGSYDRLQPFSNKGANNTVVNGKKAARKQVRKVIRLAQSYKQMKETNQLLFTRAGFGLFQINFNQLMTRVAAVIVSAAARMILIGHPSATIYPEKIRAFDVFRRKNKKRRLSMARNRQGSISGSMRGLVPWRSQQNLQEKEESEDPFEFEKQLSFVLEEDPEVLFRAAKYAQEEARGAIDDCELVLYNNHGKGSSKAGLFDQSDRYISNKYEQPIIKSSYRSERIESSKRIALLQGTAGVGLSAKSGRRKSVTFSIKEKSEKSSLGSLSEEEEEEEEVGYYHEEDDFDAIPEAEEEEQQEESSISDDNSYDHERGH